MLLLLNTVKLVLIALNIIPNRIRHKKVMFFIYMGTLVTHGKEKLLLFLTDEQREKLAESFFFSLFTTWQ